MKFFSEEQELMHFGVRGMRWGMRKAVYKTAKGLQRAGKAVGNRVKETARTTKNSNLHPIQYTKAAYASLGKDAASHPGRMFRRMLIGQKTSEMRDINDLVDRYRKAKKKAKAAKKKAGR